MRLGHPGAEVFADALAEFRGRRDRAQQASQVAFKFSVVHECKVSIRAATLPGRNDGGM